jgi:non-ribosomal peptide synthetase-like protein
VTINVGGRTTEGLAAELADILADVLGVSDVEAGAGFFDELGADSLVMAKFCARVRKRPDLPNVAMKDIYRWPSVAGLAAGLAESLGTPPASPVAANSPLLDSGPNSENSDLAAQLANVLAEVLEIDQIPLNAHFFEELGADSLTMAKFCARVRKRPDLPNVSMKDIYRDPTITALAHTLGAAPAPAPAEHSRPGVVSPALEAAQSSVGPDQVVVPPRPPIAPVGRLQYFACGFSQVLLLLSLPVVLAFVMVVGDDWMTDVDGPYDAYMRSVVFSAAAVFACFAIPVTAKWLLIGRWKPTEIRAWSWGYLRFWIVKSLVQKNPFIKLLSGSPLLVVYLRALGAKIGPGTTIFANQIPVCTDLLTIGSGTLIRKNVTLPGYHAEAGVIRTGRITIGDRVVVGTAAVLDIDTRMGDDSQLGHVSTLHPGQSVPAGERWYGCPAQPGETDFSLVEDLGRSRFRRALFGVSQLLNLVVFGIPLSLGFLAGLYVFPSYLTNLSWGEDSLRRWGFYEEMLILSAMVFFGVLLVAFPLLVLSTRLASLFVRPGRVYPLHGMRHTVLRYISRVSNMKLYGALAADSSLVVHFLRAIGWRLKPYVQTGTNFGTVVHDTPFAISVGKGTVIADGFAVNNVDYSASNFRVTPVRVGADNFVGNVVVFPTGARTGDNCLLGTMVMVPIDGPVREGVGLLGSPAIEIPRTVARDHGLAVTDPAQVLRGVRRKRRHNTVTLLGFLLSRWFPLFAMFVAAEATGELYNAIGTWSLVVADVGYAVFLFVFYVVVERVAVRYATLAPNGVSIYDKAFWRHERYWKLPTHGFPQVFNGTPLKAFCWRLLGVKVGKRLLDDGAGFPERCQVRVGDNVTLNLACIVQNHSQEDGAFKSDLVHIGSGVTLGVGSFVHYGVTVGDNAVISAAAFVMKGEQVPDDDYWGGNPAQPMDRPLVGVALDPGPRGEIEEAGAAPSVLPRQSRRAWALVAYGVALSAAGAPLELRGYRALWEALGASTWLIALGCLGVSAREAWLRRTGGCKVGPGGPAAPVGPEEHLVEVGVGVPHQAAPAEEATAARPVIPAPATPPLTAWSDALPSLDLARFPSTGVSDTWARLSTELDRLDELRAKWGSDSPVEPGP